MIRIVFNQHPQQPPQEKIKAWPFFKCVLIKGNEEREVYLPIWECLEGVTVEVDKEQWTVKSVWKPIGASLFE